MECVTLCPPSQAKFVCGYAWEDSLWEERGKVGVFFCKSLLLRQGLHKKKWLVLAYPTVTSARLCRSGGKYVTGGKGSCVCVVCCSGFWWWQVMEVGCVKVTGCKLSRARQLATLTAHPLHFVLQPALHIPEPSR